MKQLLFRFTLFLLGLSGILTSCKEGIDFAGNFEETPVVVGLLDPNDTLQYIKVMRTFGGSNNALQVAQIEDSNYYEQVDVVVEEWRNNPNTSALEKARSWTLRDTVLTHKASGAFFSPNQKVYYFNPTQPSYVNPTYSSNSNELVQEGPEYRMITTINNGEIVVKGSTGILSTMSITSPSYLGNYNFIGTVNGQKVYNTISAKASNGNAKIMDCRMRIYINEYFNGVPVEKFIEWPINQYTGSEVTGTSSTFVLHGLTFFNLVKDGVTNDPTITKRELTKIDLVVTGGTNDLSHYILINQPSSSLAQNKPTFTNLSRTDGKGVIGLFSSRRTVIQTKLKYIPNNPSYRALDYKSMQELCIGPITGNLLFCSDNPIDVNNNESWVCQ